MEQYFLPKSLFPEQQGKSKEGLQGKRVALVTGITGQDGLYLTAYLMSHTDYAYAVHGIVRKNSATLGLLERIIQEGMKRGGEAHLHHGDLTDSQFMDQLIREVRPDEVYNLAAQSHVQHSFYMPGHTSEVNYRGLMNICQTVVQAGLQEKTRIFQASTSEMFGQTETQEKVTMDENFPFNPASPYAVSKIAAYYLVRYYRNVYRLKIATGISFNHESPLRHESFITRKITKSVARIKIGFQENLSLGNLYAKRDWGHAGDFVKAFWLITNQDTVRKDFKEGEPFRDYVVATDTCYSVKEFLVKAFTLAGYPNLRFEGTGVKERLISDTQVLAKVDPRFLRPGEVPHLLGASEKIKKELGWGHQTSIDDLVAEMYNYDLVLARMESHLKKWAAKL